MSFKMIIILQQSPISARPIVLTVFREVGKEAVAIQAALFSNDCCLLYHPADHRLTHFLFLVRWASLVFLRWRALMMLAKLQVRSLALIWAPVTLSICSETSPFPLLTCE